MMIHVPCRGSVMYPVFLFTYVRRVTLMLVMPYYSVLQFINCMSLIILDIFPF